MLNKTTISLAITSLLAVTNNAVATQEIVDPGNPLVTISSTPVSAKPGRLLLGGHALWPDVQKALLNSTGIGGVDPVVYNGLAKSGGVIRYGAASNTFSLTACLGDLATRPPVTPNNWTPVTVCKWGVGEYLSLARTVGDYTSFIIANPVKDATGNTDLTAVANEAGTVAGKVKLLAGANRYWELGNELERGDFMWAPELEAQRSSAVAKAILAADPGAKTILPVVESDIPGQPIMSTYNTTLLTNFTAPLTGISMHLYYDGAETCGVGTILALARFNANKFRAYKGKPAEMWITEHARWPDKVTDSSSWLRTSNMDGVLSTADFLTGLSQIDDVAGAMLHGLRAGPWNMFDKTATGALTLSGVGKLYSALSSVPIDVRLKTNTLSLNTSDYRNKYDIRGAGFTDATKTKLGMWLINRASTSVNVPVNYAVTGKTVSFVKGVSVVCVAGTDCSSANVSAVSVAASQVAKNSTGNTVTIPAKSVMALEFSIK